MDSDSPTHERRRSVEELRAKVDANTAAIEDIAAKVEMMYSIISAAAGFFRVLAWLGNIAKPVLFLAATLAAVGAMIKQGKVG